MEVKWEQLIVEKPSEHKITVLTHLGMSLACSLTINIDDKFNPTIEIIKPEKVNVNKFLHEIIELSIVQAIYNCLSDKFDADFILGKLSYDWSLKGTDEYIFPLPHLLTLLSFDVFRNTYACLRFFNNYIKPIRIELIEWMI